MKKIMLLVLMLSGSLLGYSQSAHLSESSPSGSLSSKITWDKKEFDLGKIEAKVPITIEYTFTNHGNTPLVITEVKAQCGCTVASYTEKAVLQGESGQIKATFNAAQIGNFRKGITVLTNGAEPVQ
nr:DUF1573 domain-containing protein [Bacteroidota bacterium]